MVIETKRIQERLNELGYGLKVDNNYGTATTDAVKHFQGLNPPLVVDGIAGPKTLAVLFPGDAEIVADAEKPTIKKAKKPAPAKPAEPVKATSGDMTTSAPGRHAIQEREGTKLKAYKDGGGVWTIGCGHTSAAGPPLVTAGLTITAAECDQILSRDLAKFEEAVNDAVTVGMTRFEFDALMSLCFNIGQGAFAKSTLVKRLNAGDKAAAANEFLVWNKDNGKTVPGLTTRRQSERRQF
jgi:lysozyme